MVEQIMLGCLATPGDGGLGYHLQFVKRAIEIGSRKSTVYCQDTDRECSAVNIPEPWWNRLVEYTPLRWQPSAKLLIFGRQFDRLVKNHIHESRSIYHGFPGFAEKTFRANKRADGINILEAATVHVNELYHIIKLEHKKFRMLGNPFSLPWVNLVKREYELADFITVASKLQCESLIRNGIPGKKLIYAPLGIDTQRFKISDGQPSTCVRGSKDKFRIVQVGQVSLLKGFPYLLKAVELLGDPDIEITFCGGIGWRKIRLMIDEYRKRGLRITLVHGDPVQLLQKSHLCVHPAISDGFGLAPLEAMACGIPLIVSDTTGMHEIIRQSGGGVVIPAKSVEELAVAIAKIKHDEDYRLALGQEARNAALDYDVVSMARNYAKALECVWDSI